LLKLLNELQDLSLVRGKKKTKRILKNAPRRAPRNN
jgi:hypothetical protein